MDMSLSKLRETEDREACRGAVQGAEKCQTQLSDWRTTTGGPVVKTLPSNAGAMGSIPGQGAKIPHALWPKKPNDKTEVILTNSIQMFKMVQ